MTWAEMMRQAGEIDAGRMQRPPPPPNMAPLRGSGFDVTQRMGINNPWLGVPLATGLDALKLGIGSPDAPKGYDVASQVTDNPYAGTALATGIDATPWIGMNNPIPGSGPLAAIKGVRPGKIPGVIDASEAFANRAAEPVPTQTKLERLLEGNERGKVLNAVPQWEQQAHSIWQKIKNAVGAGEYPSNENEWNTLQQERTKLGLNSPDADKHIGDQVDERMKQIISEEAEAAAKKADPMYKANQVVDEINHHVEQNEEYKTGDDNADDMKYYMLEGKKYLKDLGNIGPETGDFIADARAKGYSDKQIMDLLKEHSNVETHGIYHPTDEYMQAWPLGEEEVQIDGLDDKLQSLNKEELDHVKRHANGYVSDRLGDYVTHDMHDSVHYLIPDLENAKTGMSKLTPENPASPIYKVKSDNFEGYLTREAYHELLSQMSSGDFGAHEHQIVDKLPEGEELFHPHHIANEKFDLDTAAESARLSKVKEFRDKVWNAAEQGEIPGMTVKKKPKLKIVKPEGE